MAEEANPQVQQHAGENEKKEKQELKYLEVVQLASIKALMRLSVAYGYAKEKSGPLKPGVETLEGTIKTVVGPVYHKFHDVPVEVLKYVDRKMDESVSELDRRVPPSVKAAGNVVSQVRSAGVVETAKTVYSKCAVSAWRKLNELPVFPQVANAVLPSAAYCTEKYNETVRSTAEKGYRVSAYLPLVPTEKIARVFSAAEPEPELLASQPPKPH